MKDYQREFLEFAIECEALRFGQFTLKSGRVSPYFFNTGLFNTGGRLARLGRYYAHTLLDSGIAFDMLYGPAYKGIPLVCAATIALAELRARDAQASAVDGGGRAMQERLPGRASAARDRTSEAADVPYAFNRKEPKKYAEGGIIVGHPLGGRVVIVDDVISAGTSVGESVEIIRAAGAQPAGVVIALDREERGQGETSAVKEAAERYGLPVASIASLSTLIAFLEQRHESAAHLEAIRAYRAAWGG